MLSLYFVVHKVDIASYVMYNIKLTISVVSAVQIPRSERVKQGSEIRNKKKEKSTKRYIMKHIFFPVDFRPQFFSKSDSALNYLSNGYQL